MKNTKMNKGEMMEIKKVDTITNDYVIVVLTNGDYKKFMIYHNNKEKREILANDLETIIKY